MSPNARLQRILTVLLAIPGGLILLGFCHVRVLDPGRIPQIIPGLGVAVSIALIVCGVQLLQLSRFAGYVVGGVLFVTLALFYLAWWSVVPEWGMYPLGPAISICRAFSRLRGLCCSYDEVGHPLGWAVGLAVNGLLWSAPIIAVEKGVGRFRAKAGGGYPGLTRGDL